MAKKLKYKIVPIPSKMSRIVRESLVSPQYESLTANVSVATGYGPCRSCLEVFNEGTDRRIYFTYNPFEGLSALPDPGPVFIHLEPCENFSGRSMPTGLLRLPVLLEAFGDDNDLLQREAMDGAKIDEQIGKIFAAPNVRFINLRNAEAGCFIARAERA